MSDLIDRQAAIDVVKGIDSYFAKYIEEIPSAHPETQWESIMVICDNCGHAIHVKRVNVQPSAQPEIIRCKDCKWYEGDIMANPWGVCCHNGWVGGHCGHEVSENGWCYRAERRTDG